MSKKKEPETIYSRDNYGLDSDYKHKDYDDLGKRKNYKARKFEGKKTIKDTYSDKTLHLETDAAKNKYGQNRNDDGKKTNATHTVQIDHIQSLNGGYKKQKKNPYLKDKDIRVSHNREWNYAPTSNSINASKSGDGNLRYVLTHGKNTIDSKYKVKMIKDQVVATTLIETELAGRTVKNMGEISYYGAKDSLVKPFQIDYKNKAETYQLAVQMTPLAISTMKSIGEVVNGDKELQDLAVDSAKAVGKTAVDGGMRELIAVGTKNMKVTRVLSKSGLPIQMAQVLFIVKDNLVLYANGEIDEAQFAQQVQRDTVKVIVGAIAYGFGEALLPIPIPIVMGTLTSMVAVEACELVYRMVDEIKAIDAYKDEIEQFEKLAREAKRMMDHQREELIESARVYFEEFDETIETSFRMMLNGISADSADEITSGLDHLLQFFGEQVKFKTYEEFDDFFMDEESVLKL